MNMNRDIRIVIATSVFPPDYCTGPEAPFAGTDALYSNSNAPVYSW